MNQVHMRLKITGSIQKVMAFHYILGKLDLDYPYGPFRRDPNKNLHCDECKGEVYIMPQIEPDEMRVLAKQINDTVRLPGHLKVKIKMFTKNPDCKNAPEFPDDEPEEEQRPRCNFPRQEMVN